MGQHDKRYRQQGGGQQEGYSPTSRQHGWNESSRQPQGDFGRGRYNAEAGRNDDWRRSQDTLGAYRDQESPWEGRGGQDPRYDQSHRYSQYGMRDSEQRYDQDSRDRYDRDRQGRFSGGFDQEQRGVGYQGGYGGYGYGYGGEQGYESERDQFDPYYSQWRREQVRALDDDYQQWRQDRFKKFSDEFTTWRSSRSQQTGTGKNENVSNASGKQNKDGSQNT